MGRGQDSGVSIVAEVRAEVLQIQGCIAVGGLGEMVGIEVATHRCEIPYWG